MSSRGRADGPADSRAVRSALWRFALGATPSRIARQLLTESLVLAFIGAAGGVMLAWLGVRMLGRMPVDGIPRIEVVTVDGRVLAFTAGLGLLTGMLFGLMPALRAYRMGMVAAMHEGGRGGTSSRRSNSALVAAQFALSFVLLIGAGLPVEEHQSPHGEISEHRRHVHHRSNAQPGEQGLGADPPIFRGANQDLSPPGPALCSPSPAGVLSVQLGELGG